MYMYLLGIWFQALHDSTNAKLIVPFGTIQGPARVCPMTDSMRYYYRGLPNDKIDYAQVIHLAIRVIVRQLFLE